jgi:hypothetical protein
MEAHEVTPSQKQVWRAFVLSSFGPGADSPYWMNGISYKQDFANLINDMHAGVPEAIDLYTKFITWKLTR